MVNISETSTFFKQYLDMSRMHISVQVNLAASFTFEHFMVGNYHDHETFAQQQQQQQNEQLPQQ